MREGGREGWSCNWSKAAFMGHKLPTQGPFTWLLFEACTMPSVAWMVDPLEALTCSPVLQPGAVCNSSPGQYGQGGWPYCGPCAVLHHHHFPVVSLARANLAPGVISCTSNTTLGCSPQKPAA